MLLVATVVLLAATVRLLHLAVFSHATVFFDPAPWNTPDHPLATGEVDRWAMQIAHGDLWWTDHGPGTGFPSPVYPYLVAAIYGLLGGRHVLAVAVFSALLGAITCGLCAGIARRAVSVRAGWLAGGLAAVYGPTIFYESFLLPETLAMFLTAAALFFTMRWFVADNSQHADRDADHPGGVHVDAIGFQFHGASADAETGTRERPAGGLAAGDRPGPLLIAGLLWGAAVAAWPLLVAVAAAVGISLCRRGVPVGSSHRRRRLAFAGGWFACGLFIAILPCTVRNVIAEGRFVLISDTTAESWRIGNSTGSSGAFVETPGTLLTPGSGPWLALLLRKAGLLFRGGEISQVTDYTFLRGASPVLSLPVPGFGVVAPLALLGAWILRRRARDLLPIHALAWITPFSVMLFFVAGRFRLPGMPALFVFAAAAGDRLLPARATAFAWGRRLRWGLLLAVALIVINRPSGAPPGGAPFHRAAAAYYLEMGKIQQANGAAAQALQAYDVALRLPVRSVRALAHAGRARVELRLLDDPEAARADLTRSLAIDPAHAEADWARATLGTLEQDAGPAAPQQ
ncbi:MAG: hypothetical protein ACE5IK_01365 [Acidobacteriota bacterium]